MQINDLLVPVDFSPSSLQAIPFAASLISGSGEIHLLHVVDAEFVDQADRHGLGSKEDLTQKLSAQAEQELEALASQHRTQQLSVKAVVVVGKPFMEIVRLAKDLDFQMIVMGTHGRHLESIEQALFGSTAEQVLRTTNLPVICVPYTPKAEEATPVSAEQ